MFLCSVEPRFLLNAEFVFRSVHPSVVHPRIVLIINDGDDSNRAAAFWHFLIIFLLLAAIAVQFAGEQAGSQKNAKRITQQSGGRKKEQSE